MATWTKLANDWTTLTDQDVLNLFQQVTTDLPTLTDLQQLGSGVRVVTLSENYASNSLNVSGVHNRTVVTPNNVFSVAAFAKINSITLNSNVTGGVVGVAVTKDLADYYIYNNGWQQIDVNNDSFMMPSQLNALTDTEWQALLGTDTTLGIAYSLEMNSITDTVEIDSLTLNVDMTGTWEKADYGTDYKYAYSNNSITIDILKNGDYKINYPIGSASASGVNSLDLATEPDIKKLFTQRSVI